MSTADDLRRQADQLNAQADQLDANQFGSADLATMNPDEINAARMAGRLDRLLGVPDEQIALTTKARTGRIDADDARALAELGRYDLIEQAHAENRINYPNSESENA